LTVYFYNRSGRGFGVRDLLSEIAYNVLICKPDVVVFHFGTNDARFRRSGDELTQTVPLPQFRKHLDELNEALRFSPSTKIFVSIAPPTERLKQRRPAYESAVEAYNSELRSLSEKLDCYFVDVRDCTENVDYNNCILADGYHFTATMHELLSRRLEYLLSDVLFNKTDAAG
jgi:lysophospholipase L1-like esterase